MSTNEIFENKTILITGGTGSIGSEIVKKLLTTNSKSIRVLSNNEHELYTLRNEIKENSKIRYLLGDIRDYKRLLVATDAADIVFHAAALKHVPLCENDPFDAVQTNVIGTQNVIEACIESNVEKFIFVSTDKAANPLSTLGATKLLAERLTIASMTYRRGDKSKPIMYCVRFGNVIGTRGSVIETFMQQIKDNQPITITNENSTRFTITPEQATELIFKTVEIAKGGEIFVLQMKSMKIIDLAESLIELYGNDSQKSQIKIIGLSDGEKIHEDLISKEEISRARVVNDMFVIPSNGDGTYENYKRLEKPYASNEIILMTKEGIKELVKGLGL